MKIKKKAQLKDGERRQLVNWLSDNLKKAAIAKQKDNKSVMRRLTKVQYTNSLNELLGVSVNFGDALPEDGKSKMGFSNNGNILQTSALHIDYYKKIAREAMDKAIVFGSKPKSKRYKVTMGKNLGDGISAAEFGGSNYKGPVWSTPESTGYTAANAMTTPVKNLFSGHGWGDTPGNGVDLTYSFVGAYQDTESPQPYEESYN